MSSESQATTSEEARKEIIEHQQRLLKALADYSYHTGDAVIVVPKQDHQDTPLGISFSYVTRSTTSMELKFTRELVLRTQAMLVSWNEWVNEQLEINKSLPF